MSNVIKGRGQRLIPEELLKYLQEVKNTYPEALEIVSANPTLEGGEDSLSSVLINGTKYAVGGGGKLYSHVCVLTDAGGLTKFCITLISSSNDPFTLTTLHEELKERYTQSTTKSFNAVSTSDLVFSARGFITSSSIRIRTSNYSDIGTFGNFDVTVLESDTISEV